MRALLKEIAKYPQAMVYAILVHVVLAAVLLLSFEWTDKPASRPKVDIVKAVAVDEAQIQAELEKLKKADRLEKNKADAKRKAEEARKRKLEQQALAAEQKRKAEEARLAKLRKEQVKEKQRKTELEQKRKAEEKRLAEQQAKQQKEMQRLAAEQAALEQKRQAEERRLAEIEAQRKIEEEQKRQAEEERKRREREAAMHAELAAEQARMEAERQKQLNSLRGQYIADIANKVERNWLKPPSARPGLSCKVAVQQIPGGEVVNVQVTQCTGDEVFRSSVEKAVYKASPLPRPSDPALFDRQIVFTFKPSN